MEGPRRTREARRRPEMDLLVGPFEVAGAIEDESSGAVDAPTAKAPAPEGRDERAARREDG